MKKFLFPFLVLLTVTGAYWVYESEQKEERVKEQNLEILSGALTDLKRIEVKKTGALQVLLENELGKWILTSGSLREEASFQDVQKFWDSLIAEKALARVAQGGQSRERFGLNEAEAELVLFDHKGQQKNIVLGTQKNLQGERYINVANGDDVLVVSQIWGSLLDVTPFQFREKRLSIRPLNEFVRFTVINRQMSKPVKQEFILNQGRWEAAGDKEIKLDQNKVRDVVKALGDPLVTAIQDEGKRTLTDPLVEFDFFTDSKNEGTVQIWLGKNKHSEWTVWSSERLKTMTIASVDAERLRGVMLDSLRDRKFPFQYNRAQIKKVTTENKVANLKNEFKDTETEAVNLLQALSAIEVEHFLPKNTPALNGQFGILLLDESGAELLRLDFEVDSKTNQVKVQSSLAEEKFFISREDFESLGLATKKEEKK